MSLRTRLVVFGFLLMGIFAAAAALAGFKSVGAGTEAPVLVDVGFPYDDLADVLDRYVTPRGVDYDGLAADDHSLRRFTALIAQVGPRTAPERFPTPADELAYFLNAYNALVLLGVIEHWPIDTVHDVRGVLEPRAGFGFFYGLRFELDGRRTNLYNLENQVIRPLGDARIHAALNCASRSCPALAGTPYRGATLEQQLDAATRPFAGTEPHVEVDEQARVVRLSRIYDWYESDFGDVLSWIEGFADPEAAAAVARARAEGWPIDHIPYDWSLNRQP